MTFDSMSMVENILTKVEVPNNPDDVFSGGNVKVIYDISKPTLSGTQALLEAQKYVSFTSFSQRAMQGETKSYFYGKGLDANIYFQAQLQAFDTQNVAVIDLKSTQEKVEIRGDQLFMNHYIVSTDGSYTLDNTLTVAAENNLFLVDGTELSPEIAADITSELSAAPEKLLMTVHNYSKNGNKLPLNYPLALELQRDGELVFQQTGLTIAQIEGPYAFFSARESGKYELKITDVS